MLQYWIGDWGVERGFGVSLSLSLSARSKRALLCFVATYKNKYGFVLSFFERALVFV
jgi:hypothetical protein